MKTLALRVKPEAMCLLLTANDFPILRRALMLSADGDQMVRTQARATYLTILRGLLDEQVREKAIQLAQEMLLFSVRSCTEKLHTILWRGCGPYSKPIVTKDDQSVGLALPTVGPYAYEGCIPGSAATKVAAAVDETPVVSVVLHGTGRKIGSLWRSHSSC